MECPSLSTGYAKGSLFSSLCKWHALPEIALQCHVVIAVIEGILDVITSSIIHVTLKKALHTIPKSGIWMKWITISAYISLYKSITMYNMIEPHHAKTLLKVFVIVGGARQSILWNGTYYKFIICSLHISYYYIRCHTKRRIGWALPANPSFCMITTKISRRVFASKRLITAWVICVTMDLH